MTDYDTVVEVFESQIREKYLLPEDLVARFFVSACARYSLEISRLSYDKILKNFTPRINESMAYTLGLIVAQQYLKRELSRINKLSNIVGKDVSLNASGSSKTATKSEYDTVYNEIAELIHKQKVHAYN